ncbi:DUF2516 family protein [Blastococcus sp. Marseille-P5729]|uniref:DUF2516 family protein n=1 Tax=Blastococcus sp. Marseille-P5729 TaxID=2086582 RepID=UPI0018FE33DB|nr:DUF2516 family protein [Blastococcus sp. Marseille-P5729]
MLIVEYYLSLALDFGLLALCLWAFVDSAIRPAAAFPAVDKLSKPAWMGILLLCGLVVYFMGYLSFLGIIAAVGIGIYLADVRPAVRELQEGGSRW